VSGRPDISSLLLSSFENASEVRLSMLRLEDIKSNAAVTGLEPGQVVRIVTTERVGNDALTVYYKTADGKLRERMLFRADEANLSLAEAGRPWAFDAPGEDFKLAAEPYRIDPGAPVRPDDGGSHIQRGTLATPNHRRVRIHAAPPAAPLRPRG